jgi:hypothetical protein
MCFNQSKCQKSKVFLVHSRYAKIGFDVSNVTFRIGLDTPILHLADIFWFCRTTPAYYHAIHDDKRQWKATLLVCGYDVGDLFDFVVFHFLSIVVAHPINPKLFVVAIIFTRSTKKMKFSAAVVIASIGSVAAFSGSS